MFFFLFFSPVKRYATMLHLVHIFIYIFITLENSYPLFQVNSIFKIMNLLINRIIGTLVIIIFNINLKLVINRDHEYYMFSLPNNVAFQSGSIGNQTQRQAVLNSIWYK